MARGALAAVSALNCGESPDTVAPHQSSQAPHSGSGASSIHGASRPHRPLLASWKPATRAPPMRRTSAPPITHARPPTAMVAATHHEAAAPCQRCSTMAGISTKNAYSSHMWPK